LENECPCYKTKFGNTTYIVCVKQAETAEKPLDEMFRKLCIHAALGDFCTTQKHSLDKIRKNS
jgi:hypothetical protein